MKKKSSLLLSCFLLFLVSCAGHDLKNAVQKGEKKLSSSQLTSLVSGSSLRMKGYGQEATVEFTPDGHLSGTNNLDEKDKGEWRVAGDALCLRFKKWREGDVVCYRVARKDDNDYQMFNEKGMLVYTMSVLKPGGDVASGGVNNSQEAASGTTETMKTVSPPPAPAPASHYAVEDEQFIIRQHAQNCPGCNLAHAQLAGQVLVGANLEGANLAEANLESTNLRRANLRGANLYRANLRHADLGGADLTGANLTEALR